MKKLYVLCLISLNSFMSGQCQTLVQGQARSLCNVQSVILTSSFSPTVAANGALYQWTVPNNAVVQGVNSGTLQTATAGIYVLTATVIAATNCTSTAQYTVTACPGSVGIYETSITSGGYKLYPNPGSNVVKFSSIRFVKTTLCDMRGKIISEEQYDAGEHDLNLSTLENGIYFFKIESEGSETVLKIVKSE